MTRKAVFHDAGAFDDGSPITSFPGAIVSVFGRTGTVVATAGDYYAVLPAALTGATQAFRIAGATTSGAPVSGTFAVGDLVAARDGHLFMCISAGTPGTWVDTGGSVSFATPAIVLGSSAAAGSAGTAIRSDSTIAAFDATSPSTQAFGDAAAVGTAAFAARRDHKHAMPATPVTGFSKNGSTVLTGAVTLTAGTGISLTQSSQDISIAQSGTVGSELDYVERTSNLTVTHTTAATADTIITGSSVSYDGSTRICIEFFCYAAEMTGANALLISLWDGSTELGRWALIENAATGSFAAAQSPKRFLTPSNASHSYLVKAWKTGGTGIIYAGAGGTDTPLPAFLRITRA